VSLQRKSLATQRVLSIAALVMVAVVFVLGCSKKQDNPTAKAPQKTFATPAEASQALHAAVQARDDKALTQVLGPKAQKLVSSGDPVEDKSATDSFTKKYDQMNRLVAMTDGSQVLYVGADNYPFPVPLAQDGSSRWYFDGVAAEEELRARKIGGNELSAMDACRLIANAEELYHQKTHQYTDTIVNTILNAPASSKPVVDHGYSFTIATTQKGFTIFASPVHYQHSGIMTFSLGRDGVLYQQDLGPKSTDTLTAIEQYNPTNGWAQAE
jgi:Protein of unknown function (DUF2950)